VSRVALAIEGKPIRTVLRWQLYATAAAMSLAAIWMGLHGALSALAGGLINVAAGAVFGCIATHSRKRTAGEVLRALYRAEAGKVGLIVVLLWVTLRNYEQIVHGAFFSTFILTIFFFSMAIVVRDR
jgi:F0F1-type ATP synthase assembly protein I